MLLSLGASGFLFDEFITMMDAAKNGEKACACSVGTGAAGKTAADTGKED